MHFERTLFCCQLRSTALGSRPTGTALQGLYATTLFRWRGALIYPTPLGIAVTGSRLPMIGRPDQRASLVLIPTRPRSTSTRRLGREGNTLALAGDQRVDVAFPHCQRVAHLALVAGPVVDARRSSPMPGLMVENLLDDVRQ